MMGLALSALAPFMLLAPPALAAPVIPSPPPGYVLDEAELISNEAQAQMESRLATLELETSTEIAVVTVTSLQGYEIEEFTLALARDWGVGQEEHNNGLVLLVAPNEHKVRIEVGYGLEGVVTDAQSSAIIDKVLIPYFKYGEYEKGILEGVTYLETLARGEEFTIQDASNQSDFFFVMLVYFLPFLYLFMAFMANSKSWWLGGLVGLFIGLLIAGTLLSAGIGLLAGLFIDFILSTFFHKKLKLPRGGSGGFWSGGSGGSSGGGFGGGGFGGGGASGSW
ncbi:TPM domain-containing protein [Patescibacteria group bacterium]|nr:TPM domain-containing protein [Patescibacteria group bacterium]